MKDRTTPGSAEHALPACLPRGAAVLLGAVLLGPGMLRAASLPAAPAAPPARPVVVRVVDRLGAPVTGLSACIVPACVKLPSEWTGTAHRFELPGETAAAKEVRLRVEAPGFAPSEITVAVEGAERPVLELRALGSVAASFLSHDGKREGSLVVALAPGPPRDEARPGKAIAGRNVVLPTGPKAVRVLFDDVPAGTWALSWSGPGFAKGTKAVAVASSPVEGGTISVRPGITVAGAVRDDLGVPVPGATVFVQERADVAMREAFLETSVTGADGGFEFAGVPAEGTFLWGVRSRFHLERSGILGGETRLDVVLERSQRVTGRVVDGEGRPVPEAKASVRYVTERSSRGGGPVGMEDDGAFAFHRTSLEKVRVEAQAKGHRKASKSLDPLPAAGWPKEASVGELVLGRGRTVRGRTLDRKAGTALPGVEVKATVDRREGNVVERDQQEGLSDEQGRFEVSGLPPAGSVVLKTRKEGFAPATLTLGAESDEVEALLGAGGRVEGILCGRPTELARSEIWMESPGDGGSRGGSQKPDASGRFVFTGVEPGSRTFLRAFVYESPLRPGSWAAMAGGPRASVTVEEGGISTLRMGCDGIPLAGLLLREGVPLGSTPVGFDGPGEAEATALTDADGSFSTMVPAPGRYTPFPSASPPPWTKWAPVGCDVPPGGLDRCLLDLRPVPVPEDKAK